jgi:hypothetical protein
VSRPAREVEQTSVHEDRATPALVPDAPALERIATTDTVLALQATAGNKAVTTMLLRQPVKTKTAPAKAAGAR